MARKNNFLARLEAKHEAELAVVRRFAVQQSKDMLLIAAHRAFGFGPDQAKVLGDAFDAVFEEYANLTVSDARNDKEIWYTKAKVDAALRDACGEYFEPWEVRYRKD